MTLSVFNAISLILLITTDYASSAQQSGILSNLYKKASQENRPLILVLDNSRNPAMSGKSKDLDSLKYLDYSSNRNQEMAMKKHSIFNQDSFTEENQKSLPYILLQHLKNSQNRDQTNRPKAHDHGLPRSRLRNRNRDRVNRLRSHFDREDNDKRDRLRDVRDRRDDPLRAFIEKNLKDERDPEEKERDDQHHRALRSSVIKNLLRISKDLNCDAQDQCADACSDNYNGKKKFDCENKCEVKFECDDNIEEKNDCETGDCELEDECGEDDDACGNDNVSTRGERWEEVTKKCNRC